MENMNSSESLSNKTAMEILFTNSEAARVHIEDLKMAGDVVNLKKLLIQVQGRNPISEYDTGYIGYLIHELEKALSFGPDIV